MRSFRDESQTIEARLLGATPEVVQQEAPEAPKELVYDEDARSRHIVRALTKLYPTESLGRDYALQDDGEGVYFKRWSLEDPPDDSLIKRTVIELMKADQVNGFSDDKSQVSKVIAAIHAATDHLFADGKFKISKPGLPVKMYDFSVIDDITLHLSYCNISKKPLDREVIHIDEKGEYHRVVYNINDIKDVYLVGTQIKLQLMQCRDNLIGDVKKMDAEKLSHVLQSPLKFFPGHIVNLVKIM